MSNVRLMPSPVFMEFAGVQSLSTIDYNGKLSAVVFTHGCNLQCSYCANWHTCIATPSECSFSDVIAELDGATKLVEAIVISGGEPTMWGACPQFIALLKNRYPGVLIKLDTNGTIPDTLERCLSVGVDYVAMDLKAPFNDAIYSGMGKNVERSLDIIRKSGLPYELRTTIHKSHLPARKMFQLCRVVKKGEPWFWQRVFLTPYIKEIEPNVTQLDYTEDEYKALLEKIKIRLNKKVD